MNDELNKRLMGLSDEDLLEMVEKKAQDYTEEAIRAANDEITRRGGTKALQSAIDAKLQSMREESERVQAERDRKAAEAAQAELAAQSARGAGHDLLQHGLFSGTRTLKDETLSEVQFALIRDAADHADNVIDEIKKKLEAARMPLDCRWGVVEVKTKSWISRVRRDFLIVELSEFPDYHTYISVRSFGTYLDCMRALTVEPGFVKKFLSRKLTGDEEALSAPKNILKHQDLSSWNEIVKDCMMRSIDELVKRLGQQPSQVQRGEKKFLDIW